MTTDILVSPEDAHLLELHTWALIIRDTDVKVYTWYEGKTVYLHRKIMNPPPDKVVDHINGNGLDNRRENLRICYQYENVRNKKLSIHKYRGVSLRSNGMYRARITILGMITHIGDFSTPLEAAIAYDMCVVHSDIYRMYNTNFPRSSYVKH